MKNLIIWATLLLILIVTNIQITKKENTLTNGRIMLLRLAPVDPRSLMQGDYMILRYAIARDVPEDQLEGKGYIVVSLDKNNVATFLRVHKGEELGEAEHLLIYRNRGGLRFGAESFFFQEGRASLYSTAEYGELRVEASGISVLTGLRDSEFRSLGKEVPATASDPSG